MSEITFTIADAEHEYYGTPHASLIAPVLAGLSLDPETFEELRYAMRRFLPPMQREVALDFMRQVPREALDYEPFDAGICILDLAGRLIAEQSTYDHACRSGCIHLRDQSYHHPGIPFHFSEDWLITDYPNEWRQLSRRRRAQRQSGPPLETRDILYGHVLEFIVGQCELARGGQVGRGDMWMPPPNWQWQALTDRVAEGEFPNVADAIAEIHARWLMTPRADLRGRIPREILLSKRMAIDRDLADREFQWTVTGDCPPELWRESTTFRRGGYGSHEVVVYYELIRHLAWSCWNRIVETPVTGDERTISATIQHLADLRDEWLQTPNFTDYGGQTPALVIDRERARIPLRLESGFTMIDPDCPLCRILAENTEPCFWHLDTRHIDEDFPFSFFETLDQWQQHQRERAEHRTRQRLDREKLIIHPDLSHSRITASHVWSRQASESDIAVTATSASRSMDLSAIRSAIDRLLESMRCKPDGAAWGNELLEDVELLQEAASNDPVALFGHVAWRCNEHLADIADSYPDLTLQCDELQQQLSQLILRFQGAKS